MGELDALLRLAKEVARSAGERLHDSVAQDRRRYVHAPDLPREIKAVADRVLDEEILRGLQPAGLPILSEESGVVPAQRESAVRFIVDPLDGTFNFVKGLGPCAVSIALWDDRAPIFGVIYDLAARELAWGGAGRGAYVDERPIAVSETASIDLASLCTGFPVRFRVTGDAMQGFWREVTPYAKVRMFGSAAISLLHVARGSADVYAERNIMLWDVAAGLAIVEGAGGAFRLRDTVVDGSCDVVAANTPLLARHCALDGSP